MPLPAASVWQARLPLAAVPTHRYDNEYEKEEYNGDYDYPTSSPGEAIHPLTPARRRPSASVPASPRNDRYTGLATRTLPSWTSACTWPPLSSSQVKRSSPASRQLTTLNPRFSNSASTFGPPPPEHAAAAKRANRQASFLKRNRSYPSPPPLFRKRSGRSSSIGVASGPLGNFLRAPIGHADLANELRLPLAARLSLLAHSSEALLCSRWRIFSSARRSASRAALRRGLRTSWW
jgi:hypothetical protein